MESELALNEKIVSALPAPKTGNRLHYFSGAKLQGKVAPSGFAVRVTAAGAKSFVWFHRVNGKPYLETLGRWDEQGGDLSVREAIIAAQQRAKAVRDGLGDPRPERTRRIEQGNRPAGETVDDMLDQFIERYAKKEAKLRSADAIENAFDRLVKPSIGKIGVYELRRRHVVDMLDKIADENGPVMADRVLAFIRKAFNWRSARDEEFNSPISKGMARTKAKDRARTRTLTDDELRTVWKAGEGTFAALVKFLLLTAARRSEAAGMTWDEIKGGDWTLPASRNKTKLDLVRPLSKTALAALPARTKGCPYVFNTDGESPISGFSKFKRNFDKAAGIKGWSLHDLRRTARSLMSRGGVNSDHAERCLGHVIAGVRGTYDRHEYHAEKKAAYEALATQINAILEVEAGHE
ncbi:MAG TPA: site-specific integrase [Xanthobacteraceae bacterium]|nr:site-specific integrase [Xanthobacteraceae bacterium]